MILEGEIKDAKMSSFSSDFQTLIKHKFPLFFLYELLMSLRSWLSWTSKLNLRRMIWDREIEDCVFLGYLWMA